MIEYDKLSKGRFRISSLTIPLVEENVYSGLLSLQSLYFFTVSEVTLTCSSASNA